MSRNSRILEEFKLRTSGVSRAWWPANMRHCLATGRLAQKRRLMIMKGIWWARISRFSLVHLLYLLCILVAMSLLLESMLLVLYLWRPWAMLLLLTATWTVTLTVAMQLLRVEIRREAPLHKVKRVQAVERRSHQPMIMHFPETPMPATPLVRVLETIDLSSSEVEHFLNPIQQEIKQAPESQMGLPTNQAEGEADIITPESE